MDTEQKTPDAHPARPEDEAPAETPAEAPAEAPAGFIRKEFTRDGRRYVYDFSLLSFVQAQLATEVMLFKKGQLEKPAKSVRDMLLSGGGDYLARVFAYLVIELDADGNPKPFVLQRTYDVALAFVNALPATDGAAIEECIKDFFTRTGKESVVSTVLLREFELDVQALLDTMLRAQIQNGNAGGVVSSPTSESSEDSTVPMNSHGDAVSS